MGLRTASGAVEKGHPRAIGFGVIGQRKAYHDRSFQISV
jgi:hypothetical protein